MTDLDAVWSALESDGAGQPGLLLRRLNVPTFDVHLTQERPSRRLGFFVKVPDKPGTLWKELRPSTGLDIIVEARPGHDVTLLMTERDDRYHDIFAALVSDLIRGFTRWRRNPKADGRSHWTS